MSGPFDDLDPEAALGDEKEAPPEPTIDGDRLRWPPAASPTRPAPVDHRPRRTGARPARHDPRRRPQVGGVRAFVRGLVRRCPRCGGGGLFERRLKIRERCPRCGFRLEREEGGFLGAMTINYGVTALAWLAVFIIWLVVDLPDVHTLRLTIVSIAVAIVVPLLFWRTSKTLWAAVDYLVTETEGAHIPEGDAPWDELERGRPPGG